jgi:hypothetical protein
MSRCNVADRGCRYKRGWRPRSGTGRVRPQRGGLTTKGTNLYFSLLTFYTARFGFVVSSSHSQCVEFGTRVLSEGNGLRWGARCDYEGKRLTLSRNQRERGGDVFSLLWLGRDVSQ